MSGPFDVAMKHLVEAHPADCVRLFEPLRGARDLHAIDADLSTIAAQADKVLRVNDPPPFLVHLEFQAGYDPDLGPRMLRYNVLLHGRHGMPVFSGVILLRPEADGPEMTDLVQWQVPAAGRYLEFHYASVRLWQKPVEAMLSGGVGMLPFAPLADVTAEALPTVVRRMEQRLSREVDPPEAATLWTSTYVLMGLLAV